jgi:hypothetical protein
MQGNNQGSLASGHKSGGLVLVLALGLSAHPKNARDLTWTKWWNVWQLILCFPWVLCLPIPAAYLAQGTAFCLALCGHYKSTIAVKSFSSSTLGLLFLLLQLYLRPPVRHPQHLLEHQEVVPAVSGPSVWLPQLPCLISCWNPTHLLVCPRMRQWD